MQEETDTLFVSEEEAGERLDKILATRLREAGSRTYFQYLIDEGKVLLNGLPVKKRVKPKIGDEIELEYVLTPELTLQPENLPLNILYEDQSILVVDKAPGMVVHPATGHWTGTFVNALLFHCHHTLEKGENADALRPGIVHRLDKDTSGLIIAAKTGQAQQKLIEMFAERRIYKEYLAICIGNPKEGTIEAPIGRHPINRKMMAVLSEGRPAITRYRSVVFDEKLSLVSVVIETGRTHQIRVHMKHHRTPVLGDPVYGIPTFNAKLGVSRQMLHAYKLTFEHPISGKKMELTAEIPEDMQKIINLIKPR